MTYKIEKIKYNYNSLEPYIDKKTMHLHHDKHHQGYADKLNKALKKYPKLQKKSIPELLKDINKIPKNIRSAVINNGGGVINHDLFFKLLKKNTKPSGEILEAINKQFGSFQNFKEEFSKIATTQFASGWTWLVKNKNKLEIIQTKNHETPITQNKTPILVVDIWEHTYYLKYKNLRADFIKAFMNIINWKKVNELFTQ